ncbi:asparagine synthase (glutamine-hydrolyzing) [Pontixanthobacter aestiaquae]|uniref:asparagine synthase (glutamine-hydrolyzing) n=1 Tax=Pontixanthobacter aestiaquae TaxID=1509367 RepID=A0A844Z2Z1_9SPHN|nr:asparagine synthase (glutamine-hydrolyzing) [Pontixanthobacter aestiaquae]MDN3646951.1 asparagine synthase (glutamine-hydrolyzing) [Pontixanthobacter aestiaquae]MXO82068.1 asparagine synthase (glutamine-hydrolyzing) [Pontixanthobacter aestiaquae]
MCGLTGIFGAIEQLGGGSYASLTKAMSDAITHRGPDAEGLWADNDAQVALGHRRLSILDLSPAGAQPMHSKDDRLALAFNGEIYNFAELRSQLEARHGAIAWRGHSDTEILLECFARDGIQPTLDLIDGMFGMAVFDKQTRELTLIRDAFGEKPLYYGLWKGCLLFGSELKALEAVPGFAPELDLDALGDFFKYSYVPGVASIWEGVSKLPPAHRVTIGKKDIQSGVLPDPQAWWDMTGDALIARAAEFDGTLDQAVDHAETLMREGTARRTISDVPLGAFLSGGIDSSLTVAMMQANASQPVRTFSIGMAEEGFDESPAAKAVADHLGTDHTELVLTPEQVQAAVPTISGIHDEPFADSSQVPTYLVAQMARREVTVALSGDGGDEIFGGYNRYFQGSRVWNSASRLPGPLRRLAGGALASIPAGMVNSAVRLAGPLAPKELTAGRPAEKLQKLARVMAMPDEDAFHDRLLATSDDPLAILSRDVAFTSLPNRLDQRARTLSFAERAMLVDTATYMADDVLVKVDRAAMAVALETRTPYLDRDLFRFAWSLPTAMRYGSGEGKTILRELLYRHVPQELVDRPKAGFAIPVGRWLRTGLRDWAESELSDSALGQSGLLHIATVRQRWDEHVSGKRDHETMLWNVLMFQSWYRNQTS